jgi:hypothetical protein
MASQDPNYPSDRDGEGQWEGEYEEYKGQHPKTSNPPENYPMEWKSAKIPSQNPSKSNSRRQGQPSNLLWSGQTLEMRVKMGKDDGLRIFSRDNPEHLHSPKSRVTRT